MSQCFNDLRPILLHAPLVWMGPEGSIEFSLLPSSIVSHAGGRFCLASTSIPSPDADLSWRNNDSWLWYASNLETSMTSIRILLLRTIPGINGCAWRQTEISSRRL